LLSLYTPTNSTAFLEEAWQSLKDQDADFEWIIVPNGNCQSLPQTLLADSRVHAFPATHLTGRIGALKKFAVKHAQGDVFIEFDHDDLLMPNALKRIADSVDATKPQFLFSDFAAFEDAFKPFLYDKNYGWQTYPVTYNGRELIAHRQFDIDPVALSSLHFSPNHVRVWTRAAYELAGHYSEAYDIADDYELMLRTYLTGAEFIHIPECLYLQRMHRHSASAAKNAQIQSIQQELSNQNAYHVLDEWRRRNDLPAFALSVSASTESRYPVLTPLADTVRHETGVRFQGLSDLPDNSVGRLEVRHLLPYLPPNLVLPFFEECHRVLAAGGWLCCQAPSTDGRAAFTNPLYRTFWNETTFWTFTKTKFAALAGGHNARFYAVREWTAWPMWEHRAEQYAEVCVDLVALKGQTQPGWTGI
jgi:hypothetical protein